MKIETTCRFCCSPRAKQAYQKGYHDVHCHVRKFHIGKSVMARNMFFSPMWMPGIVVDQIGPLIYVIQVPGGRIWKMHMDHLCDSNIHVPVIEPVATSTNSASALKNQIFKMTQCSLHSYCQVPIP